MPRRIKVCQVLSNFVVGGAEIVALDVARGLNPEGFESLAVAVIEPRGEDEPPLQRRFREAGVPAHALHHRGFRDPRTLWDMARFFRRHRPDIIHGHKRFSDAWACRVGGWVGVPHRIWTRHSVYRDMTRRQLDRYRRLLPETPVVLAVSEAVRRNCIETEGIPPGKVRTVVNGIDTERFAPRPDDAVQAVRRSLGVAPDDEMLLFVGRLIPEKTPAGFLRLVARLRERGRPVRGFLCGDGPLRASLAPRAPAAGVTMLGMRQDVPDLLAACDLLVSTSRVEGLPLNVMEAMATGAAFVGPDLDQVLELVHDEPDLRAGLFARPPLDAEPPDELIDQWVEVTARQLDEHGLRQRRGERGRRVIVERFSTERMVAEYAAVYRELMGAS